MDNTVIQAALWIGTGGLLILFLKRRRSRKPTR